MSTHQWGLTQQFTSSDQVSNGDVEVGVAAAPVGDLGEGVCDQNVLHHYTQRNILLVSNRLRFQSHTIWSPC